MPPKRPAEESSGVQSTSNKPTPKERGCFQCSRRRIICDKAEPSCGKCIKKGIECSGVNRIRFTEGVARRGKLKDCKVPNVSSNGEDSLPTTTTFPAMRWIGEKKSPTGPRRARKKQHLQRTSEISKDRDELDVPLLTPADIATNLGDQTFTVVEPTQILSHQYITDSADEGIEEIVRTEHDVLQRYSNYNMLQPWIAPLSAEARMLFSYFSEAVAPVMVILDTASNGYRELFLPMALEDEVLRRAVGVVAAQHLSRERPEMQEAAEAGRAAIISRLRRDSMSATVEQVFNKFTWATLIVLLVGETVTGSADYSFLVQMLLCLSANSMGDDQKPVVNRFLQTQTNMFALLSLPLIGEHNGVLALQRSKQWQDWLTFEQFPEGSENHRIIDKIRLCYETACDIYMRRAMSDDVESTTSTLLQHHSIETTATTHGLINQLAQIPPEAPGAHALVWPCFVGGAEATDPAERAFFVNYMNSVYARTKFRNIPAAVRSLQSLWDSKGKRRWTQCLPEHSNVLVM